MVAETLPPQTVEIAKAQDWTLQFRVLAPEKVTLDAPALASAIALTIKPLETALSNGDKLLFGKNTVVTLGAAAAAGVTSLTVSAIAGPLQQGDVGQKIRDLTGYTIEMEVLENAGDATPLISLTGADITLHTQTAEERGLVDVAGVAADTSSLTPGDYAWALWRRNSGTTRPLATGTFKLYEAGFL